MSRSDYLRPSERQIHHHYKCQSCRNEIEVYSDQFVERCHCGGSMSFSGESYPSNSDDWEEELGRDGEWRQRR